MIVHTKRIIFIFCFTLYVLASFLVICYFFLSWSRFDVFEIFHFVFLFFLFWIHALKAKSKGTNIHTNTQIQKPLLIIVSIIYVLLFQYQNARFQCVLKWILCFLYMCVLCMCASRNKTISEYFLLYAKDTKLTPKKRSYTKSPYTITLFLSFFLKN